MSRNQMEFALVFTGRSGGAKAAAEEVRAATASVTAETEKASARAERHAAALDRETVATLKAADAARRLAEQEKRSADYAARVGAADVQRSANQFAGVRPQLNDRNRRADATAAFGGDEYAQVLERIQARLDPLIAAQQRYKKSIEDVAFAERMGAISASQAIDMRLRDTHAYNTLASKLENRDAARKAMTENAVSRVTVTPDRGADVAAFMAERDQLRAKYNPVFAVLTKYKAELAEIRDLERKGVFAPGEMTAEISRRRQTALATVDRLKGRERPDAGGSGANDRYRVQNLGYQVFDFGQSAALGMPLPMVAMQQLPQVIQLYAGQGGMNAALKDFGTIASGAAKMVTPLTVGIGALTAVVTTGAVAYNGYLKSTKEVETAAAGLGRAVAGSAAEMEQAAQAGAAAAGISVKSARSMEAQFLRTGKIGAEHYEELIGLSKDFAATMGIDASAAGEALAQMFADPAAAAENLYRKYGLIDAATARNITNLVAQNRQSEAQGALLDALPERLAKAEQATTMLGRAWDWVGQKASNAGDAIGKGFDKALSGPTLEERLEFARDRYKGLDSPWSMVSQSVVDGAKDDFDTLLDEKRRRDRSELKRKRDAEETARSVAVIDTVNASGVTADQRRRRELENSIATLRSGEGNLKIGPEDQANRAAVLETRARMLDAIVNKQSRLQELDRLDIQISSERNPMLRAELEARRTRLQMADQEVSAETISMDAARARNRVIEETIASASAGAAEMRDEIEIRARLTAQVGAGTLTSADANRLLQEEMSLRPLVAAATTADVSTKERLSAVIANLRDGYAALADQEKRMSAMAYVQTQSERLEQLRLETSLIGANDNARRNAIALLEAEREIRRRGIDGGSDLANQIREQSVAIAEATGNLERHSQAWDKVRSTGENTIDTLFDKFSEGDWSGALEDIGKDWSKTLLQLGGANPMKNALLGTNNPTMDDVGGLGGMFSKLFGGGMSISAMTVTAATVSLNGGLAGSVPLLSNPSANDNGQVGNLLKAAGTTKTGIPLSEVVAGSGLTAKVSSEYAPRFQGLLNDLKAAGYNISSLGEGGYSYRTVKGTGNLSKHAFGEAIDINPRANPWSHILKTDLPPNINELAQKNGLFWGGNWRKPDTMHFQVDKSVDNTAIALKGLTKSAETTQQGLGSLGAGFGEFGKGLSSFFPAAPTGGGVAGGGGSGIFSSLLGLLSPQYRFAAAGGVGLWSGGGYTGPGGKFDPRGVVHAGEVIWSQDDVARAGGVDVVEAMRLGKRGYAYGGAVDAIVYPSFGYAPASGDTPGTNGGGFSQTIINNSGAEISTEETTDQRGNRQQTMIIGEHVATALSQSGNPAWSAMQSQFDARPRRIAR